MLTASILAATSSLSLSQWDLVTILRRGDIPYEASGVGIVWIEYEVRHQAGAISKMYLTYVGLSVQTIPDPGDTCSVIYITGLVDGTVYGIDDRMGWSPLDEALIIEDLRCQKN